jgi:GH25 family lysozyme M1 (1,4-beta-N-acetylmuramidase)
MLRLRSMLPLATALLTVSVLLPAFAGSAAAASTTWASLCSANVRTSPKTTASVKKTIPSGTTVTAVGTVTGGAWSTTCPSSIKGSTWLKITAINGKSTSSLFGTSAVYGASGLFKIKAATTTTTTIVANCDARLRSSTSTAAKTITIIDANSVVTTTGTVTGGSWSADCMSSVSGTSWYRITAVGGRSTSSLYGVSAVYAAKGLFRGLSAGVQQGIDVSHWQGTIDWAKVKASGRTFVFAKATEGIGFEDSSYDQNKAGAMAAGLHFGAYHFARPGSNNPVTEADWFVDTARLQHGMLLPVLDLELTGGLGTSGLTTWVKAWLGRVYERTGVRPMIYTSPSFWRNAMGDSRWFADNGYSMLWVAHWGVTSPSVPGSNWGGRSWTFWQYSNSGTVPGISGGVDLNLFRFSTFDAVTY